MRSIAALFILFLQFTTHRIFAQDSTLVYSGDILGAASATNTPFWIRANQYGIFPQKGPFLLGKLGVHQEYNKNNPRVLQWSGGIEAAGNISKSSALFLNELFLAGKAGPVEISIGKRKEFYGLADTLLSSGSIAMSQNYRPYPKIQLSSPQFINLIPGHELISFKFTYSDGLLGSAKIEYGNVSQVPQIYFHHKSLYFKLGGHNNKINLFAGFNHQAMWGGEAKIFSGGLKTMTAYKYVVLGKPWEDSRVGNHFGTIDLAGEWKGATWSVFVYRQSIYEDGSLAKLSNIKDGLNGIRFKRPRSGYVTSDFSLNTFLLEYLYTKSQGGNDFDFSTGVFGRDNYFNHYVYSQGWSYKGNSLGTPIIGPKELNKKTLDSTEGSFTNNNRLYALHLALAASWGKVNMTAKVTFSNNFGTYNEPFIHSAKQSSLLFYAERPVSLNPNSLLTVSFAADKGSLYSNAVAILVGWKYRGILH